MNELKNIKIDKEVHHKLKVFCSINGIKLGKFVERIILSSIDKEANKDDRRDENLC